MPEWLGRGLQNLLQEFNSPSGLQENCWASGGIGRRSGLKIRDPKGCEGSSPSLPTSVSLSSLQNVWRKCCVMRKYPCRCRRCRTRRTFAKHPEVYRRTPLCSCGGVYIVDSFRKKKEHKKYRCTCGELPFPHRKTCKWCFFYKGEYDVSRDIHPFLGPMSEHLIE